MHDNTINTILNNEEPIIAVRNLCKSFNETPVLSSLDFDLHKGENLVVLGRSGSGKSVLLKLIAGLLRPDSGTITVMGQELTSMHKKELRQLRLKIGFIFQGSALFDSMTVRENIEFSLLRIFKHITPAETNQKIEDMLQSLGLQNTSDKMPAELSGGQKKRVGVARTLILHPDIMLYDEPTGGLDPLTSVEMNDLIREVQQQYNTSSIIITHDLTCAKHTGDRLVILDNGTFIREGSFEQVFESNDPRTRNFYNYNFTSAT